MFFVKLSLMVAALCVSSGVEAKRCCCAKHSDPVVVTSEEQPAPPKVKKVTDISAQESDHAHDHAHEGEESHTHE